MFTFSLLQNLHSAGAVLKIVHLILHTLTNTFHKASMYDLLSLVKDHWEQPIKAFRSRSSVQDRKSIFFSSLPSARLSSPCRPPARSHTVNLILTNKAERLGSQS